ncbi:MAG TPA: 1,4-dihydroxy-6-naphthoate synthase [Planctomycetota bacterium]|nr:1,4-dihydroxy-6-naphthoate synthase [Planctomycetota bacterium]
MSTRLRVGLSTCPNDTYAFCGLLEGEVRAEGLQLDFELADVQALNEGLAAGHFDVVKASFAAALDHARDWVVLPVGAALGFGVGPLVVGAPRARRAPPRVLCPGRDTTATLLWNFYGDPDAHVEQVVFSAILPAVARGEADLGVCIHEGRFTYRAHGLELVEDLGERWERDTGAPLPLGGILARSSLAPTVRAAFTRALAESLAFADAHPERALAVMRRHAREHDDAALWKHVELYVNAETRGLSQTGRRALATFAERAQGGAGPPLAVDPL